MLQNINFLIIQYYKIKQAVNEKKSKKFRSPLIFYNICEFLDDDSLFELKFVCVSSRKFIQNDEKLENITLKLELKKLRKLKRGEDEEIKTNKLVVQKNLMDLINKNNILQITKNIKVKSNLRNESNYRLMQDLMRENELSNSQFQQQYYNDSLHFYPLTSQEYHNNYRQSNSLEYHDFYSMKNLDLESLNSIFDNHIDHSSKINSIPIRLINKALNQIYKFTEQF